MKTKMLVVAITAAIATSAAHAQFVNPLLRPQIDASSATRTKVPPLPNPSSLGAQKEAGGERQQLGSTITNLQIFLSGWVVSLVTGETAVIRREVEQITKLSSAQPEAIPSQTGILPQSIGQQAQPATTKVQQQRSPTAHDVWVEVEHNKPFAFGANLVMPKIKDGVVTLYYVGDAEGEYTVKNPIVVFVGNVVSRPLPRPDIHLERPDMLYAERLLPQIKGVVPGQQIQPSRINPGSMPSMMPSNNPGSGNY